MQKVHKQVRDTRQTDRQMDSTNPGDGHFFVSQPVEVGTHFNTSLKEKFKNKL